MESPLSGFLSAGVPPGSSQGHAGVVLLVVAAPNEAQAILRTCGGVPLPAPWRCISVGPYLDMVVSGISKANSAGAAARVLDPLRHRAVLSIGIAGSLPGEGSPPIGSVVLATSCIMADEGMQSPTSFSDCAALGFPLGDFDGSAVPVSPELGAALRPLADVAGPIATVSTCSGTDDAARRIAARTGAIAESMEGAAVALVGARLGIAAGEVRVISNTTGDRPKQTWRIREALDRLAALAAAL